MSPIDRYTALYPGQQQSTAARPTDFGLVDIHAMYICMITPTTSDVEFEFEFECYLLYSLGEGGGGGLSSRGKSRFAAAI